MAGLHVLEFSWVIATPSAVRILADYGATVVKVETESRPDTMRTVNPFVDEEAHPDNSVGYGVYNAGKRSISLDLDKPESRDVVLDLVRWADVATESFAPGAFDRMGYGYDVVSEVNPRLVLLSSSLLGRTGPSSGLAGYGFMAAAIAGFYELAGWPDRGPAGPYGPYTDYLAPRVVVASLMAALEQRRRTGRGCHIDLSQTETALHYLSPAILDAAVNGRTAQRCGNDDPQMSPHGVFPSAGDDAWVAVACADGMWPALAGVVGLDSLAGLTQAQRRERADEIAAAVSAWTSEHGNDAAARLLQGAGVDAYPVNNAQGCCDDPQLSHRNHHIDVPQSHRGTMWTHNCRTTMSRTPPQVWRGGPCLGEDNFEVLSDFLGYDGDRIADLAAAEVLG
ncbi:MAG TPA: CoA transferase [Acidimicrobiaceae bacterium]|nr:CoA transferase [Acidimicrobiaceae bacterium]